MGRVISWASLIIWLLLIFSFSQQPASESKLLSSNVTKSVVETVEKVSPDKKLDVDKVHHTLRKNAHFFLYFVLGVLVVIAFRNIMRSRGLLVGGSFLFCFVYACTDEIHQLFVPGRGAQVSDVLLDSAGAGLGIAIFVIFRRIKKSSH